MKEVSFYGKIIRFIDVNVIYCLLPMIFTLIIVEFFMKGKFPVKRALNVISWTILVYTFVTIIHLCYGLLFHDAEIFIRNPATSQISGVSWFMFLSAVLLPLSLFIKKLRSRFWFVMFIAIVMKSGIYFERYVILATTIARDYPEVNLSQGVVGMWLERVAMTILQAVLIIIILFTVLRVIPSKVGEDTRENI